MIKHIEIEVEPEKAFDDVHLRQVARNHAGVRPESITDLVLVRRSLDARRKAPIYRMAFDVYVGETPRKHEPHTGGLLRARADRKVIIVGAGPAGYFAALQLLEHGIQPVIFDRGKDVQKRRKDLRSIQQFGTVDPDSNYCFGEGGAGTYSDGKLYTAAKKRGNVRKVLELLVDHGAHVDILVDAHPHIGSNKLPQIVQAIRHTIEGHGGEVHFASQVTDLVIREKTICGVIVNGEQEHLAANVILATGHSARDIYELLHQKHVRIEAKPFAMGIRIEHAQGLIDQMQYHESTRSRHLPAASYKMVTHVDGRGVFSFCMCPGGLIVPAATAPGEIIVNGMSLSARDSAFANAGIVVGVERDDVRRRHGSEALAGLRYQRETEERIFAAGDGSQQAPSQRMIDFVEGRLSGSLPAGILCSRSLFRTTARSPPRSDHRPPAESDVDMSAPRRQAFSPTTRSSLVLNPAPAHRYGFPGNGPRLNMWASRIYIHVAKARAMREASYRPRWIGQNVAMAVGAKMG